MSVSLAYVSNLTVTERLESETDALPATAQIIRNQLNTSETFNATSDSPVTQRASDEVTMTAGAYTIDLTAVNGTNDKSFSASGLKLVAFKFKAPDSNATVLKVAKGASNGYAPAGTTFDVPLGPGDEVLVLVRDPNAIGGSAKTFDVSGTGTDKLRYSFVFGT